MSNKKKYIALTAVGMALSVIPPVVTILSYFPVFAERNTKAVVSGIAVLLLIIASVPLFRYAHKRLGVEAMPLVWVALFFLAEAVNNILDKFIVVCAVGAVSNVCAYVLLCLLKI